MLVLPNAISQYPNPKFTPQFLRDLLIVTAFQRQLAVNANLKYLNGYRYRYHESR